MFYAVTDSYGSFFQVFTWKQALSKLELCSPQVQIKKLNLLSGKWAVIAQRTRGLQGRNVFKVTSSTELVKQTEAFKASRKFFRANPEQALMASAGKAFEKLLRAIPVQVATCAQVCLHQGGSGCKVGLTQGQGSTCHKP